MGKGMENKTDWKGIENKTDGKGIENETDGKGIEIGTNGKGYKWKKFGKADGERIKREAVRKRVQMGTGGKINGKEWLKRERNWWEVEKSMARKGSKIMREGKKGKNWEYEFLREENSFTKERK